ncbi:MAG: hypothetical protein RIB45_00820 [Marivibrio sp.]|uniref:hypothetical protein n=1 Tax=Marivibrio sp. TaxID=2039719 RepID=UPI0032ECA4BE
MTQVAPPSRPDIKALRVVGAALRYMVETRRDLLMIATPPVIALAIVETLVRLAVPDSAGAPMPGEAAQMEPAALTATLALLLLNLIFYVMFAVAWHRKYLVPQESVTVAGALKWRREKTLFLLRVIAIFAIAGVGLVLVVLVSQMLAGGSNAGATVGGALAALAFTVVFARLSLVLPAMATGREDFRIADAWRASKGNALGMFLILLLPTLFALAVSMPVALLALGLGSAGLLETATGYALLALFGQAANYLVIALTVSSLSIAYEQLAPAPPTRSVQS